MENVEVFKDVPELENKYSISTKGRVYSKLTRKYLKPYINKKNGIYVLKVINKEGKPQTISIVRLMALTFLENPNLNLYNNAINISGIHSDLNINNIMWGSSATHVIRKNIRQPELLNNFIKSAVPRKEILSESSKNDLIEMRKLGYSVRQLTDIFKVKKTTIFKLLQNK